MLARRDSSLSLTPSALGLRSATDGDSALIDVLLNEFEAWRVFVAGCEEVEADCFIVPGSRLFLLY